MVQLVDQPPIKLYQSQIHLFLKLDSYIDKHIGNLRKSETAVQCWPNSDNAQATAGWKSLADACAAVYSMLQAKDDFLVQKRKKGQKSNQVSVDKQGAINPVEENSVENTNIPRETSDAAREAQKSKKAPRNKQVPVDPAVKEKRKIHQKDKTIRNKIIKMKRLNNIIGPLMEQNIFSLVPRNEYVYPHKLSSIWDICRRLSVIDEHICTREVNVYPLTLKFLQTLRDSIKNFNELIGGAESKETEDFLDILYKFEETKPADLPETIRIVYLCTARAMQKGLGKGDPLILDLWTVYALSWDATATERQTPLNGIR